jgi:hypothetical protein
MGRKISKTTGFIANPADPGDPPGRCGIDLVDVKRVKRVMRIDLGWFDPEICDLLAEDRWWDMLIWFHVSIL